MPLWNIVKQNDPTILGKLSKLKSGEIWEMIQIGGGSSKNQKKSQVLEGTKD